MEKEINLTATYTEKDYRDFLFLHLYRSWGMKIMILIAIIMVGFDLLFVFKPSVRNAFPANELPTFNIVFPIVILLAFPLFIYLTAKKSFKTNFRLKEDIKLSLTEVHFQEQGETFNVTTPWNQVQGVVEKKNIFIIKHSRHKKGFIPKRFFSAQQQSDFSQLLANLKAEKKFKM